MTSIPCTIPEEVGARIDLARQAAERAEIPQLPSPITEDVDPPIPVAGGFTPYLPPGAGRRVTRADLLDHGRRLTPESSTMELQDFLFHVNAWGYGTSGYGLARTRRVLIDENRFTTSARAVISLLQDPTAEDAAVEAYYFLHNRRAGAVAGWGPAFFTKFLTFADPANQPGSALVRDPALILDRWTATAVTYFMDREAAPRAGEELSVRRFAHSSWSTPQYAYYIRLMRRLAGARSCAGPPITAVPMHVERVLFHYFRDGDGSRIEPAT